MDNELLKPRIVIAKITRTTTEKARVVLDRKGNVESIDEILEEIDYDNIEVGHVFSVLSEHD